jgi:hypothetical protein
MGMTFSVLSCFAGAKQLLVCGRQPALLPQHQPMWFGLWRGLPAVVAACTASESAASMIAVV